MSVSQAKQHLDQERAQFEVERRRLRAVEAGLQQLKQELEHRENACQSAAKNLENLEQELHVDTFPL